MDTNASHYHSETKVLSIATHMKMIASQYRESARHPDHPMNQAISEAEPDRRMKKTPFDLSYTTMVHSCDREN